MSLATADDHPDIAALRQTTPFREHVARLFTPLKPGLAYVRTMEFAVNYFERHFVRPDIMDALVTAPLLLHRARLDGIRCVDYLETEIVDLIELDAIDFLQNPNPTHYAWNASDAEELRENLSSFCDGNIEIWEENHYPSYHVSVANDPTLTDAECGALSAYVKSFVGCASATLPYHLEEGSEELYYDSADTEEAMDTPVQEESI